LPKPERPPTPRPRGLATALPLRGTTSPSGARLRPVLVCAAALLATGCTIGPRYTPPGSPPVQRYTAGAQPARTPDAAGTSQHFAYGRALTAQWWTLFRSPALDRLLQTALKNNPTLEGAQATLRQAQATLQADEGVFYPQVSGTLGVKRQRFSGAVFGGGVPSRIFNLFTGNVNITYYPDFFGVNRLVYRQQNAQVDFQRFQMQAAYLTLESNVVTLAITAAELHAQIDATRAIIADQAEILALTQRRYGLGAAPYLDVVSQRSQLAAARAALPPLEQRLAQTRHQLAVLAGAYPAQWKAHPWTLTELRLPESLPVTLPSTLVQRRPDIRAAEAQMRAANAQVGIDTARMYPVVSLTASFGQESAKTGRFFNSAGNVWNVAADLAQPLFQGGTLRAQRRASQEAYRAMAADYRKTVLGAFGQVADALRAVENDARTLQAQEAALSSSREALKLARAQYAAGAIDYLRVLNAQVAYGNARIAALQARAQRLRDSAALFAAIGGGWWPGAASSRAASDKPTGAPAGAQGASTGAVHEAAADRRTP